MVGHWTVDTKVHKSLENFCGLCLLYSDLRMIKSDLRMIKSDHGKVLGSSIHYNISSPSNIYVW